MRHKSGLMWPLRMQINVCMEQKREVERYRESVREKEGNKERDGEWEKREKYTQFGREELTDHPLGEGLG